MTGLGSLLARLDEGERVRGRGFERLCKWVLENAPEYAARLDQVWLWDEWPGNEGRRDAGIDVVARTVDGELWAVQAKHLAADRKVTKREIDSFLTEAGRYDFDFLLLITSGSGVNERHAKGTLTDHGVGIHDREWLLSLDLDWDAFVKGRRPKAPKQKRPRPHQRRAVKEIVTSSPSGEWNARGRPPGRPQPFPISRTLNGVSR